MSLDRQTLVSSGCDQTIRLWDLQLRQCRHILNEHSGWVQSGIFSSNGQILFSGSDDRTIKLWNRPPYGDEGFLSQPAIAVSRENKPPPLVKKKPNHRAYREAVSNGGMCQPSFLR